jgi:membrane fusion protein, copper/silver efflux system
MAGAPLFRINGLNTVWVNAEVRETQASELRAGTPVEARTAAVPDKVFKGKVSAILPEVSPATRTLKARIELANPGGELKPGMFATVDFTGAPRKEALLVPSEALIRTGKRTLVILAQDDGKFAPVEVETGLEADGQSEIRRGLEAGQKVVLSGQFLIDSEASLRGAIARMGEPQAGGADPAASAYQSVGKVESVAKDEIILSHEPIAALKWPAMTMGFKPPARGLPKELKVGDSVRFEFRQGQDGKFEITTIERKP